MKMTNKLVLVSGVSASWWRPDQTKPENMIEHYASYETNNGNNGGYSDWQSNDSWVLLNKNIESKYTDANRQVGGYVNGAQNNNALNKEWWAHTDGNWAGLRHGLSTAIWYLKRWEQVAAQEEFFDMGNCAAAPVTGNANPGPAWVNNANGAPKNAWFRYETRNWVQNAQRWLNGNKQSSWNQKSVTFHVTTLWNVRSNWSTWQVKQWWPQDYLGSDHNGHDLDHQTLTGWDWHNGQWMNGKHSYGDINKDDWCPVIGMFDGEGRALGMVLNTKDAGNKYLGWDASAKDLCNASQKASKALQHLNTEGWNWDQKTGEWSKGPAAGAKAGKDGKAKKKEEGCCGCSCCCCVVIISLIVLAAAGVVLVLCCCCKKNQDDDSL